MMIMSYSSSTSWRYDIISFLVSNIYIAVSNSTHLRLATIHETRPNNKTTDFEQENRHDNPRRQKRMSWKRRLSETHASDSSVGYGNMTPKYGQHEQ